MRGINELAKHDTKWREIAFKITWCKTKADDLVQDMYLKLMDKDKDLNDYYVTMTLKSLFIDGIRKSNKTLSLIEGMDVEDKSQSFEPTDEELEILNKIKALPYRQQEFIAESYDNSLREIESIYNINYGFIYRELHKGLDAVLGDAKEELYNNSNMKIRKAKKK
tara:strand:- start:1878 stop:2372 length:495 start_codon:yes stop_codon:yes gene_type:complete